MCVFGLRLWGLYYPCKQSRRTSAVTLRATAILVFSVGVTKSEEAALRDLTF